MAAIGSEVVADTYEGGHDRFRGGRRHLQRWSQTPTKVVAIGSEVVTDTYEGGRDRFRSGCDRFRSGCDRFGTYRKCL